MSKYVLYDCTNTLFFKSNAITKNKAEIWEYELLYTDHVLEILFKESCYIHVGIFKRTYKKVHVNVCWKQFY
jgi:hypothetical protein